MPNYDLHTGLPHEPNTLTDLGFGGMTYHETNPPTSKEPAGPHYNPTTPVENQVNPSADTEKGSFPTPSGTFARRTS